MRCAKQSQKPPWGMPHIQNHQLLLPSFARIHDHASHSTTFDPRMGVSFLGVQPHHAGDGFLSTATVRVLVRQNAAQQSQRSMSMSNNHAPQYCKFCQHDPNEWKPLPLLLVPVLLWVAGRSWESNCCSALDKSFVAGPKHKAREVRWKHMQQCECIGRLSCWVLTVQSCIVSAAFECSRRPWRAPCCTGGVEVMAIKFGVNLATPNPGGWDGSIATQKTNIPSSLFHNEPRMARSAASQPLLLAGPLVAGPVRQRGVSTLHRAR